MSSFPIAEIRGYGHLQYLGENAAEKIQIANGELIEEAVNKYDKMKHALEVISQYSDLTHISWAINVAKEALK